MVTPQTHATGLVPQSHDARDILLATFLPPAGSVELPPSHDLSRFALNPIYNQWDVPLCQSASAKRIFEVQAAQEGLPVGPGSVYYTYYYTRKRDGNAAVNLGGTSRSSVASLAGDGLCPQLDKQGRGWPDGKAFLYIDPRGFWLQNIRSGSRPPFYPAPGYPVSVDPTEVAHKHKGWLYMAVAQGSLAVKTAIFHNHAVTVGIQADTLYATGNTGIVPLPDSSSHQFGYHAIPLLKYDDNMVDGNLKGFFRFPNSWGPEWGDNGWGYIAYEWFDSVSPNIVKPFDQWAFRNVK